MPNLSTSVDLVERDVIEGLSRSIEPRDGSGFSLADGFEFVGDSPITDPEERVVVVPWRWIGQHVEPILGVQASGRVLEVRGVTMVTGDEGDELLHRYIDWAEVLLQLEVRFYERPVVDGLERWGDELREVDQFARLAGERIDP
jgi:hypothetical protein